MSNILNRSREVSVFKLQLRYYVHFRINTPGKEMNFLSLRQTSI